MNFWRITCKDLLVLWRDRRSLVILLALPLVFITIIGLSTGQLLGWQNQNEILQIAAVNEDGGELATSIIARLKGHDGLDVIEVADAVQGERLVQNGSRMALVRFGPEFQSRVDELTSVDALQIDEGPLAAGLSELDVHITAERTLTNVEAVVELIVHGEVLRSVIPYVLEQNALIRRYIEVRRQAANDGSAEVVPQAIAAREPAQKLSGYGSVVYQTIVPSYTVLFTFFLVTIMASSFLTEQEAGTMLRLQTLPVSRTSLMIGKTLPFLFISLAQGALLFLAGKVLFGMSWGRTPWWLPVVIACTSLSATSLGLLTATIVRTTSQASTTATLVILVMAGISGCFMPRAWLPESMQQISLVTPHAWSLIAYDQLLEAQHPDHTSVVQSCVMLIALSGLYFMLGWWRFGRRGVGNGER